MERSASDGSQPERAQLEQSGCAWWWWVFALLIALTVLWAVWAGFGRGGSPGSSPKPIGPMRQGM
jgi:hypothetical protein